MRRLSVLGWLVLAPGLLGGCNNTEDLAPDSPDKPFPLQAAEAASTQSDGGIAAHAQYGPALQSDARVDPARVYSLLDLIDLAQRRNQATRVAWELARQAAIGVGIARADLLPSLTVSAIGGYQRLASPFPNNLVPRGYITANAEEVLPELAMRYLLFDFGRRAAREAQARQLSTAANITFTAAHQQLILTVARAYFTLDGVTASLQAARQGEKTARLLLEAAEARQAHGLGTVVDTALARHNAAQAAYDITAATTLQHNATYSLLEALNLPPGSPIRVEDSSARALPRPTAETVDRLMTDGLRDRPDLLADLAKLRASEAGVALARASLNPTIGIEANVQGNIGRISVDGAAYDSVAEPQAGVFLAFHWPIFQGGLQRNQIRLAESQRDAAADQVAQTADQAMRQVALAYGQLGTQLDQYDAAVTLESAAQSAFDAARDAYEHGVGTFTDAASEQARLAQARAARAQAHSQALIDAAGLAFATGKLTSGMAPGLSGAATLMGAPLTGAAPGYAPVGRGLVADVSVLTVVLSAGVSVVTGYIGTLMNYSRQRRRQRRTYGLALLAEIKSLRVLANRYYGSFKGDRADFTNVRLPQIRFSSADTAVFNNVAGNVGLFSTRAAVEIIEYYAVVRHLVAQAQALADLPDQDVDDPAYRDRLADHIRLLRVARRHSTQVVAALRRETPTDFGEKIYNCRRRLVLRIRLWSR